MNFYSQLGEDFFIFKNLINQSNINGTFIELGAFNGIRYSNTKFFEDTLGFNGILIEPIPEIFQDLQKNRRNCFTYNFAISNSDKKFIDFIGNDPSSGIPEKMAKKAMDVWHSNDKKYKVRTNTLSSLIKKSGLKYIDILSIDVEGGELEVLKTLKNDVPIYLICIELDENDKDRCNLCRGLLTKMGFRFLHRLLINEFWINDNYPYKERLFKSQEKSIGNILDYKQHFIENHCIPEINKNLIIYDQTF